MLRPLSALATFLALLAAIALTWPAYARAAPGAPSLEVRRTATPPKIDGLLDDPAWREAAHSDAFRQFFPQEDSAATERTEFWITYDSDNIYVAIRCHDSAGLAGLRVYSMQHDQDNGSDDIVRIVFDTFHRENDGYYFALTAAGGKHEGLIQNKTEANDQWDTLWHGKVTRDAGGWSAEFAIPVKSLAFDPANDVWGFNVARAIRRKQEAVRWSGWLRNRATISLPDLGTLRGITGLKQGRGFDFKPYASLTRHAQPQAGEKETDLRPGFDLIWHATPSLAATLTINTDFADAEVDDRQINLGRFPLFYPEKRTFFNQDASLFAFSGLQTDPLPFFSRRIGLAEDGTKVDILGGLKLTGRAGPWTLGLLDVQMDRYAEVDSKNLFVGRAALQVLDESSVGLVCTHGDPRSNGDNTLVGADFNYANNHLPDNKTFNAHASVQLTDSDYAQGRGTATVLFLSYPNEPFEIDAFYNRIDAKYDPALGFVPRTGIQDLHLFNRYRWLFAQGLIQQVDTTLETDHVTDLHGRLLESSYWFPTLEIDTRPGDFIYAHYQNHREDLDTPFEIQPGIIIPTGDYRWDSFRVVAGTTRSRPINARINFQNGGFYGGHRTDYNLDLGWRPSSHLELGLTGELHQVRLPEGDFDARVGKARAVYTFTPDLQLSLLGQYDNLSAALGVNFRVRWTVQPGNDLYFIVNQGYEISDDNFRPVQNDVTMKAAWTIRF